MGCRFSKDETDISNMSHNNEKKIDYKSRLEKKMCLARETPEPIFDLSECNLKEIPSGVFVYCCVLRKQILNLSKNKLTTINGGSLFNLQLLQILNLSFNNLEKLPNELSEMVNLRELILSYNSLIHLPTSITELKNLEIMDLSFNKLQSINEIRNMPSLTTINLLGNNELHVIPKAIVTCNNLTNLIVDENLIRGTEIDIIDCNSYNILNFIGEEKLINKSSIKEEPKYNHKIIGNESKFQCNEENPLQNEKNAMENICENDQFQENVLIKELQIRQQKQRERLFEEVMLQQEETSNLFNKVQRQKDSEKDKLLKDIQKTEHETKLIIDKLLNVKSTTDPILLEKERLEQEQLLEKLRLKHSELRKKEILATMINMFDNDRDKIEEYQKWKDKCTQDIIEQETETVKQLSNYFKVNDANRSILIEEINKNEELQKHAVSKLIVNNDARSWGLVEQLKIVEYQLAEMTKIEIEQKNTVTTEQMNTLAEERLHLAWILSDLFQQRDLRTKELLNLIRSIEAQRTNEQDFWLLQYQRLLDSSPLEFSLERNSLDPILGYNFLLNGVIHCLPFFLKVWQQTPLDQININSLRLCGIQKESDQNLILKSIHDFLHRSEGINNEKINNPSAPQMESEENVDKTQFNNSSLAECIICMDREVGIVFIPCGHMCCCILCEKNIIDCPLCRSVIDNRIKAIQP